MMSLVILARGHSWLVVDKPAGMSVHNDPQDVCRILGRQLEPGTFDDVHPVHRLDKETSGLLLVALDSGTARDLSGKLQERSCEKVYLAIVRGALPVSETWQTWSQSLSDKAEGRRNPRGQSTDRVEARTDYRVSRSSRYLSLMEVRLLTGRQHQIRKHSAIAGHAIVGDRRYGDPGYNSRMAGIYGTDSLARKRAG